jgi:hypothetical protein
VVCLATIGVAQSACVLGPEAHFPKNVTEGAYCASPHPADGLARAGPDAEDVPTSAGAARAISARSLATARAIGALALVERLSEAEAQPATDQQLADLRGQLNDAITLARLDLASVIADMHCEEGRAGQIATALRDAESAQTKTLTAYSLAFAALAALGAGVTSLASPHDVKPGAAVDITGGVLGGALGVATLTVHRTAEYRHTRNALGEIWSGGAHPDFPEIVWAYLTRPTFALNSEPSVRAWLVREWKESGRLGKDPAHPSEERVALYFGAGGTYDADALDDRVDMLSELREALELMNHDLRHLAAEAVRR